MSSEEEQISLDRIAKDSWYCQGANKKTIEYSYKIFMRYLSPSANILELGPAEGIMTEKLVEYIKDHGGKLTVVDGSREFCTRLHKKYWNINIVHSLFEDYSPSERYQIIILGHVLEHVENPVAILKLVKSWLAKGGIVLSAVPNAFSLHRQAAVLMGLLTHEKELNDTDKHHGHRRVYTIDEFKQDFLNAGFILRKVGGYWIKPVSNKQIDETWTNEMLDAYMVLGEKYPEIAAEIYVVAEK